MTLIDAHAHLWLRQDTTVDGQRIYPLGRGRAMFFGEERQMLPPFMTDGVNSAEIFLANMDYAQVQAAVIVQEVIDGNQDAYLLDVQKRFPDRFFCCALKDVDHDAPDLPAGFRGIAIPGHRAHRSLTDQALMEMFKEMESKGLTAACARKL